MATLVLSALGAATGIPGAAFVGGVIGTVIDSILFAPDPIRQEGPRRVDLKVQANSPGEPIARLWGEENRLAGALAWTSGLKETKHETEVKGGKLDKGPTAVIVEYTYAADVAILVCRGPIIAVRRIWANKKLFYDNGTQSRAAAVRIVLGTLTQDPDSMLESAEGVGNVPAWRNHCVVYIQDLQLADFGDSVPSFEFEIDAGPANLQDVVSGLVDLSGIPAADYDVGNLPMTTVDGFTLKRLTSPRKALEMLAAANQFDASDTGAQLVFRRRSRAADMVLDENDFGAGLPGKAIQPESTTRESERQLPQEVVVTHADPSRDLQTNAQRSNRLLSGSTRVEMVEYPGTLTAEAARNALDDLVSELWQSRKSVEVSLPPKYLAVDAGDIVRFERTNGEWPRLLVTRAVIGANLRIKLELRPLVRPWAQRVAPSSSGTIVTQVVPETSDSVGLLFDLPLLTDSVSDESGFYAAASDVGNENEWLGAVLYHAPNAVDYVALANASFPAVHGTADGALATGPFYWPDRRNTVNVTLSYGTLSSITESDWLHSNSKNAALLGDELIQFRDATFVSGTTWTLSKIKRGRRGTEWARGSHSAGDVFLLLERRTVGRIRQELGLLNDLISYKMVTVDQALADVSAQTFTVTGVWAKPWAGLDAVATRDGSDNITITWRRRGRQFGGTWVGEVPLGEVTEAYEVDIMDGATVKRALPAVTSESVGYSIADQTTDWGGAKNPVEVNIYQISGLVQRGYALNATV